MQAHLLFDPHFDPHLVIVCKDLVHVLCDASRLLKLAADQGYARAQYMFAGDYRRLDGDDDGTEGEIEENVRWLRLAADQGFAPAQRSLANLYETGRGGVPEDAEEALRWYRLAMEQDDIPSIIKVSMFYRENTVISRDLEEARRLILLAVDLAWEQGRHGEIYTAADHSLFDRQLAISLYEEHAIAGCWDGARKLAEDYSGSGMNLTPLNNMKAYMWDNIAASRTGYGLEGRHDLTRTQEVEAQQLTEEWLEAHPVPPDVNCGRTFMSRR